MLEYNQDQKQQADAVVETEPAKISEESPAMIKLPTATEPKKKSKLWLWIMMVLVVVLVGVGGWWYYAQGQAMLLVKDMQWIWGEPGDNYQMNYDFDLALASLDKNDSFVFDLGQNLRVKVNGSSVISGQNFEGQLGLDFTAGEDSFALALKNKKVDSIFYAQVSIPEEFASFFPVNFNDTWVAIDQGFVEENSISPSLDLVEYQSYLKGWNLKFNNFLNELKDKKLLKISDPHENKKTEQVDLKKINFSLKSENVSEFIIIGINSFVATNKIEEAKKSFEDFKTKKPENWQNFQELLSNINFSFWLDQNNKNIFGFDLSLEDFELTLDGQKIKINFLVSQMLENIAAQEILAPENAISMEEFQRMFLVSIVEPSVDWEPILSPEMLFSVISLENLAQLQSGVNFCLQENKEFNPPQVGSKMCDGIDGVPSWPDLENDYQWSNYFVFSSADLQDFEFCVYNDDVSGVTCTEEGCALEACLENKTFTNCEGFAGTDCISGTLPDADEDLLLDSEELNDYFTDPNNPDTDGDTLLDGAEVMFWLTDPNNPDTDGDGYSDGEEVNNGYNPNGEGLLEV